MPLRGPNTRAAFRTSFVLALQLLVQVGTLLLVTRMLGSDRDGAFANVTALAVFVGTPSTFGTHLVLLGKVSRNQAALRDAHVALPVILMLGIAETVLQPLVSLYAAEHQDLGRIARARMLAILPLLLRRAAATTWQARSTRAVGAGA